MKISPVDSLTVNSCPGLSIALSTLPVATSISRSGPPAYRKGRFRCYGDAADPQLILSSIRQCVTIPPQLAPVVRRVAKEKHLSMSRALVVLPLRGVEAETAARDNLKATYHRFMSEAYPARKGEAGKDLIRAIFGHDAIAEDSIL